MSSAPPQDLSSAGFEARLLQALPRLRGYVATLTARSSASLDTDDVLQDVAAKALRSRHSYDPARALLPWLRRAALHAVLDAQRAANRRPLALESDLEIVAAPLSDASVQRDELKSLLARIDTLPRELLLRFHREGQSVAEIATALHMPEGTVKLHLHRARRKLRQSSKGTQ